MPRALLVCPCRQLQSLCYAPISCQFCGPRDIAFFPGQVPSLLQPILRNYYPTRYFSSLAGLTGARAIHLVGIVHLNDMGDCENLAQVGLCSAITTLD